MLVILGLDGLEYNYVEEFGFKELKQAYYGKTDISEFEKPRTLVIWSSFISGKNMEKEVLSQKDFWDFKVPIEKTLFSKFKNFKAIDVPGFCFDAEQHKKERQGLKEFFDKKISIEDYDKLIFTHHKKIKQEFFEALKKDYNVVMGYFGLADVVGHLSFGIKSKMKMIYQEHTKGGKLENFCHCSDHIYSIHLYRQFYNFSWCRFCRSIVQDIFLLCP